MWKATPLILLALVFVLISECNGILRVGFYRGKCGRSNVERIVFRVVEANVIRDQRTIARLIRLQFHDCFVRGCDASILLDGWYTEKNATQNQFLRGYEVIDQAKRALEWRCPGVVSCADIIAIACRSAMFLGGSRWFHVETGRRDGRHSYAREAYYNIPLPTATLSSSIRQFARKGLNIQDFVVLLGCHTVGAAHCTNIRYRLYNYHHTMRPDPRMNRYLLYKLRRQCPPYRLMRNENNIVAFLDQTRGSQSIVDNAYYKDILAGTSVLEIDQQLGVDPRTRRIVRRLARGRDFSRMIGPAMVKMGRIGVLTGHNGEIRRSCRWANSMLT